MIGRNDPCPCGSGKKYKKCCSGKSEVPIEKLVDEELHRILLGVYEQSPGSTDFAELNSYRRQWGGKLGNLWDGESIEESVSEYFLFVARRDLWMRYLLRVLNTTIRSAARSVVETWKTPIVLFGKVGKIQNDFIEIDEVLGDKKYFLKKEDEMPVGDDSVVFGVVLPDDRNHPNGIYVISSLMFIKDGNGTFRKEVMNLAESSGFENSIDFYKEHMVDIYRLMLGKESSSVEELIEQDLTEIQKEAIAILEDTLEQLGADPTACDLLKNISVTYFLKENPNFRKPNVISAAVFLVAVDLGMLAYNMTNVQIAKLFEVSTNSMTKHADRIHEFVFELAEEMSEAEGVPTSAMGVGTDPRITERMNWEMFCKMSRKNFDTFEEMQGNIDSMMNESFHPEGRIEQAQAFIYDAYDAENDLDRYRFAEKAANIDLKNVDALLLKAEIAETNEDADRLYKVAIHFGETQFEQTGENPWGLVTNRPYLRALFKYGVWLFEGKKYEKAGAVFNELLELNPNDNQGARYLAISSFTQIEDYERASEILEDYEEGSETDAIYLYLDWYTEVCMTEGESEDSGWMLEAAIEENPYVEAMMDSNLPKQPYPRRLELSSGSIEEAMYIWILLN